jgi:hypothetical protein
VENLTVRNNTVFRCRSACASVSGWSAADAAFTGNVLYQDISGGTAFSGSTGAGLCRDNVYFGQSSTQNGFVRGAGLSDFASVTVSAPAAALNFYPVSDAPFVDLLAHASDWPQTDFNGTARPHNSAADAGAYEYTVLENPGWQITGGFKDSADADIDRGPTGTAAACHTAIFQIRPNPVSGTITLYLRQPEGVREIVLYDLSGKNLRVFKAPIKTHVQFDTKGLAAGVYLVRVKREKEVFIKRVAVY